MRRRFSSRRCATDAATSLILVALLVARGASAEAPAADEPLIGLWAYETTFGPALRGELTVRREEAAWHAALAGAETRFKVTGGAVHFEFPRNLGKFRGAFTSDARAIEGFWLQPSGITEERQNPTGSRQAFATPLALHIVGRGAWRGTVQPLEERFTLYLRIFRDADGVLLAAFRNPEVNSIGGTTQYRVSRDGNSIRFDGITRPEIHHTATLLQSPPRLQIRWDDVGRRIELTQATPRQTARFCPRPRNEPRYAYSMPPDIGDGWQTARARDVGIEEAALSRIVQRLADADPAVRRPNLIHSVLVARRGKLVLEEYFYGFDRDTPHDLRSAGKTFASVMLGAVMMRGMQIAPETAIYETLSDAGPFANPDPRKSAITLAHLLTHTSGLACDDNDDASPGNENTMQRQGREPDWWKYTLDLPMAHDPGSRYAYCSANINLVGAALTKRTGMWLPELFDRTVARPLQFGRYHWNLMPTDEGYLGGGAWLRPRDLLKVGQTYLDGGVWKGRRIVEESWIKRSTAAHVQISPVTTGLSAEQFPDLYIEGADGYAWHMYGLRAGGHVYPEYEATGNGGQLLIVVPDVDLVAVFTGGNFMQGGIWSRWKDEIIGAEIIPVIRPETRASPATRK